MILPYVSEEEAAAIQVERTRRLFARQLDIAMRQHWDGERLPDVEAVALALLAQFMIVPSSIFDGQ